MKCWRQKEKKKWRPSNITSDIEQYQKIEREVDTTTTTTTSGHNPGTVPINITVSIPLRFEACQTFPCKILKRFYFQSG